jgi:hypothetical protein
LHEVYLELARRTFVNNNQLLLNQQGLSPKFTNFLKYYLLKSNNQDDWKSININVNCFSTLKQTLMYYQKKDTTIPDFLTTVNNINSQTDDTYIYTNIISPIETYNATSVIGTILQTELMAKLNIDYIPCVDTYGNTINDTSLQDPKYAIDLKDTTTDVKNLKYKYIQIKDIKIDGKGGNALRVNRGRYRPKITFI